MKNAILAVLIIAVVGGATGYIFYKKHEAKKQRAQEAHRKLTDPNAFKVGLVTPGPFNEGGWNQNAVKALDLITQSMKAETYKFAAKDDESAHTNLRKFAEQRKASVVIGHASEYNDAKTAEIAAANPNTTFLISGSEKSDKNVCGVRFVLEDATFVLGQLAASMSKSNLLGCVGPKPLPVIASTFEAFEQGAKSVKPDIKVSVKWTQDFSDIGRAKSETLQLINDGADFIFQNADNAAQGVFEAVQENKDKGVYVFGSNDDQALTKKEFDGVILASAALNIPAAYLAICKEIQEKKFENKTHFIGMPGGMVTVAFNKKLEDKIPAEVRKKIDETIEKLKQGEQLYKRKELK